jgi:hypothetical protein
LRLCGLVSSSDNEGRLNIDLEITEGLEMEMPGYRLDDRALLFLEEFIMNCRGILGGSLNSLWK